MCFLIHIFKLVRPQTEERQIYSYKPSSHCQISPENHQILRFSSEQSNPVVFVMKFIGRLQTGTAHS